MDNFAKTKTAYSNRPNHEVDSTQERWMADVHQGELETVAAVAPRALVCYLAESQYPA